MAQQQNVQTYEQLYQENNTLSIMHEEILLKYTEAFEQCTKYKKLYKQLRMQLIQKNDDIKKRNKLAQHQNQNDQSSNTKLKDQYNILKSYNETIKKQNEKHIKKIDELTNANAQLQSNMITLTQKHHAKQRKLTLSKQKLLGQIESLKADLCAEQHKNLQLLQNIKTITEQYKEEEITQVKANAFLAEIERLNNVIYAKDKFHTQLQSDNDLFRRQLDDCRLEIAIFNSQKQDKLVYRLNEQLERLQGEIKQYKQQSNSQSQSQFGDLLEVHAECEESLHSLTVEKDALEKEVTAMKQEQIVIREENKKLIDAFNEVKLQVQEYSNSDDTELGSVFNPCEEKGDILDGCELILFDDELCMQLEEDLENYRSDQRRKKKLKELRLFHEKKAQIVRDWNNSLFNNGYRTLWEKILDKLEDKYDDDDDDDEEFEHVVYKILFDAVIECYEVLHNEYNKIAGNEYMSPNVIDMVLMNITNFYDLMKRNKLTKRIVNISRYINDKVEKIYKCVECRHSRYVDIDFKPELCQFIVECCETIWSVLHYKCSIYPLNSGINASDIKYNDKIHEKEGDARGDDIEFCIFPAIMKENEYQTKMWVICDQV